MLNLLWLKNNPSEEVNVALVGACEGNNSELVMDLIKTRNANASNVVQRAVVEGSIEIVESVLKYHKDSAMAAMRSANTNKQWKIVALLVEKYDCETILSAEKILEFIESGCGACFDRYPLKLCDKDTALSVAIQKKLWRIAEQACKNGAIVKSNVADVDLIEFLLSTKELSFLDLMCSLSDDLLNALFAKSMYLKKFETI